MRDELGRIAAIAQRLRKSRPDVHVSIGDDAAVLAPSDHAQAISVDVAVEGVHFRRDWIDLTSIGRRAVLTAASDLAAMGATPTVALSSMVIPKAMDDDELFALVDGVALGISACGGAIVGGNLASGTELSITTTVVGTVGDGWLGRDGAKDGDRVFVTGPIGGAALGLELLKAGVTGDAADPFIERWRQPPMRFEVGQALLGKATAAVDLSDGLLQDLGHVCAASGVGAVVEEHALPLHPGAREMAEEIDLSAVELALSGGEDYELLFTAPESAGAHTLGTPIGRVTAQVGQLQVLGPDGKPRDVTMTGYRHF